MAEWTPVIAGIRDSLESALEELELLEDMLDGPAPVAEADILANASADTPFAEQSGYTAQVVGTYTSVRNIPEDGIHGATLANGESLRFGKEMLVGHVRPALVFQVAKGDPSTSGGKRAELSFWPMIEADKVYWIAFSALVYDWGTLAMADQALFGCQMHDGDNSLGLSPSFALYTSQAGRHFRVQARYSKSSTPSQGNSVSVKFDERPIPFGLWSDFVFKFRHNQAGQGFLMVWENGEQIADHHGDLGYSTPSKDYAKFGYYNWTAGAMNDVPRKVLMRQPTVVLDPTGQSYTLEQIAALLG